MISVDCKVSMKYIIVEMFNSIHQSITLSMFEYCCWLGVKALEWYDTTFPCCINAALTPMLLASTCMIIGSSLLKYCNIHELAIACFAFLNDLLCSHSH